jgi:hypothetical protein
MDILPHSPPPAPRGLVTISGADAFSFLQNIVSNDLALLESHPMIWACLLTPQGKYLHDFFVTRDGYSYILNCEAGARAEDLARRLSLYKLRADIVISCSPYLPQQEEKEFMVWDEARIRKALPDGSRDAEISVSTLAELNLDSIAVSYTKGCYIGQELVARMHNRNLGKKHLVAVEFGDMPPPSGTEIENFGQMRSSCGTLGLILMNRESEDTLKQGNIKNAPFRLLGL